MPNAARKYVFGLARVPGSGQSPTSRQTVKGDWGDAVGVSSQSGAEEDITESNLHHKNY